MRVMQRINSLADQALTKLLGETTAAAGCIPECGAWGTCVMSTAHCSGGWHKNRTCINTACNAYTQVGCC
ncbi:hypothetical protein FB566_0469 [Stackebrandtia endophytica]|uniref:Uncharacterized protein n=2 Tax=Stackebrandtia endophytica TaxID=1496996 RepID=A0A543AQW6_9ACTN|nr:hypothetical protein FB566_0469 [Stackebrandtia endophytica]